MIRGHPNPDPRPGQRECDRTSAVDSVISCRRAIARRADGRCARRRGRTRSPTTASSRRRRRGAPGRRRTAPRRAARAESNAPPWASPCGSGSSRPDSAIAWSMVLILPLARPAITTVLEHREPQQRHAPLAQQHDDGDPPPDVADERQPDEGHAGDRLVGDRVGDLAEVGDQVVLAGEVAVDLVGDHRDDEQGEGHPAPQRSSRRRRAAAPSRRTAPSRSAAWSGRWAMFQLLTWRAPCCGSVIRSLRPRRAIRSTPSVATTSAATQVADARRRRRRSAYVVPSTSGPWWAARPSTSPSSTDSTSTSTVLADPLLGALGGELLDQRGHVLGAGADLVLVQLAVVRRRPRCRPRRSSRRRR